MKCSVQRAASSPARAAEYRKQARFGQQLSHELPPRRAEREPHRHLGRASGRPREQQVRDVGARDQQDAARDAKEEQQGQFGPFLHPALPSPSVHDRQRPGDEPRQGLFGHVRLERRLHLGQDAAVQGRDGGAGLLDGDLRLQAGEEVEPVVAAVLETALGEASRGGGAAQPRMHRERDEHHGRHVDRGAAETGRGHADDGQRLAVDQQHLSEHIVRSAELDLPQLVAQDDDRMPARRLVDFRTEQSPQRRHETQRREVRAGDLHALDDVEGAPFMNDAGAEAAVRRDAREHGLLPLQVAEHRVAEHLVAAALARATGRAGLRPRGLEIHEPLRLEDRQRTQQELAVEGEDRGVRPDAQSQRHDRHGRDDRGLDEHAQRQPNVGHHLLQLIGQPQTAGLPARVLRALHAAEVDAGAPRCLRPRHPGADQVRGMGVEVKTDLLVERVLEAVPPGPGPQERAQAREHVTPRPGWRRGPPPWPRRDVPNPPPLPGNAAARRGSGGSTWRGAGSRSRPIRTR